MEALLSITIVILGLILIPVISLLCYIAYKIGYKKVGMTFLRKKNL